MSKALWWKIFPAEWKSTWNLFPTYLGNRSRLCPFFRRNDLKPAGSPLPWYLSFAMAKMRFAAGQSEPNVCDFNSTAADIFFREDLQTVDMLSRGWTLQWSSTRFFSSFSSRMQMAVWLAATLSVSVDLMHAVICWRTCRWSKKKKGVNSKVKLNKKNK